mgnify:CR=1 FL=1
MLSRASFCRLPFCVEDAYGSALQKAFQDEANQRGVVTDSVAFSFSADLNGDEIENAIQHLKETEFRQFYVICFEIHLKPIIQRAIDYAIIGPAFVSYLSCLFAGSSAPHLGICTR